MNLLFESLEKSDTIVERMGWVLVHSLWQFAVIGLLSGIAMHIMRRQSSDVRCGALTLLLSLFIVCPAVTLYMRPSEFGTANRVENVPSVATNGLPSDHASAGRSNDLAASDLPHETEYGPQNSGEHVASTTAQSAIVVSTNDRSPSTPRQQVDTQSWTTFSSVTLRPWLPCAVGFWTLGVLVCAIRPLAGWFTLLRLKRVGVTSATADVVETLKRVSEELGLTRSARVLQSSLAKVPVVVGYLQPVILLPASFVTNIPAAQLKAILAHELAHIRRHDFVVNLVQILIETLFFYHPAAWWISHQIRVEREHCCDDMVIKTMNNRADYGRALIAVEELRSASSLLALGATDGSLLERIRRISGQTNERTGPSALTGLCLLGCLIAAALVFSVTGNTSVAATNDRAESGVIETDDSEANQTEAATPPPAIDVGSETHLRSEISLSHANDPPNRINAASPQVRFRVDESPVTNADRQPDEGGVYWSDENKNGWIAGMKIVSLPTAESPEIVVQHVLRNTKEEERPIDLTVRGRSKSGFALSTENRIRIDFGGGSWGMKKSVAPMEIIQPDEWRSTIDLQGLDPGTYSTTFGTVFFLPVEGSIGRRSGIPFRLVLPIDVLAERLLVKSEPSEPDDREDVPLTPILELPDHLNVMAVRFSQEGKSIVSVSTQRKVAIRTWDIATQKKTREVTLDTEKHANFFLMGHLLLSTDCTKLLTIVNSQVKIWDAETGKLVRTLELPAELSHGGLRGLACTPDFSLVACGTTPGLSGFARTYDAHAVVWNTQTGEVLQTINHAAALQMISVALSPDGKQLATGTQEAGTRIWDLATGELLRDIPFADPVRHFPDTDPSAPGVKQTTALRFSPDGKQLAIGGIFGARLLDASSGEELHRMEFLYKSGRSRLVFSADSQRLAMVAINQTTPIWSTKTGKLLNTLPSVSNDGSFSPDNNLFASGRSDKHKALLVWQLAD